MLDPILGRWMRGLDAPVPVGRPAVDLRETPATDCTEGGPITERVLADQSGDDHHTEQSQHGWREWVDEYQGPGVTTGQTRYDRRNGNTETYGEKRIDREPGSVRECVPAPTTQ